MAPMLEVDGASWLPPLTLIFFERIWPFEGRKQTTTTTKGRWSSPPHTTDHHPALIGTRVAATCTHTPMVVTPSVRVARRQEWCRHTVVDCPSDPLSLSLPRERTKIGR